MISFMAKLINSEDTIGTPDAFSSMRAEGLWTTLKEKSMSSRFIVSDKKTEKF